LHKVQWTEDALDDLHKLDGQIARRILKKITWFASHFDAVVPEPLSGDLRGIYKLRVGDWRVLYIIEEDGIVIEGIGHRKEVYDR
jgi:mRNA interferase RelE/StbE